MVLNGGNHPPIVDLDYRFIDITFRRAVVLQHKIVVGIVSVCMGTERMGQ